MNRIFIVLPVLLITIFIFSSCEQRREFCDCMDVKSLFADGLTLSKKEIEAKERGCKWITEELSQMEQIQRMAKCYAVKEDKTDNSNKSEDSNLSIKSILKNNSENLATAEKAFGASNVDEIDVSDYKNYKWAGTYNGESDDVTYALKIDFPGPLRWTEFGWEMNVSGIQTYYLIKGYCIRDEVGNLEFHYIEQIDGAFYQSENMNINDIMFKLKKEGNLFIAIDGIWKASDFIHQFNKTIN